MNARKIDNGGFFKVSGFLPFGILTDIEHICSERRLGYESVNEVRLRYPGRCSVVLRGENVILNTRIGEDELREVLRRVCDMALYAHRDDIGNGFVSLDGGTRVGVCGHAKYDGGKFVGVSSVSALVFRIPTGSCDFADKLFGFWREHGFGSMLICSRAGVGKTTAIRALAKKAGRGGDARRVVVVDERCELDPMGYKDATVDILRGYKRSKGIEIAIRTMSPEVLIVDEIGSREDSEALLLAIGAGTPVVATAHGDDMRSIIKKPHLTQLFDVGLFELYSVITLCSTKREVSFGSFPFAPELA